MSGGILVNGGVGVSTQSWKINCSSAFCLSHNLHVTPLNYSQSTLTHPISGGLCSKSVMGFTVFLFSAIIQVYLHFSLLLFMLLKNNLVFGQHNHNPAYTVYCSFIQFAPFS